MTMRKTQVFLDQGTDQDLALIRERVRLASDSAAIRYAVRECADHLRGQGADAERRVGRAGTGQGERV